MYIMLFWLKKERKKKETATVAVFGATYWPGWDGQSYLFRTRRWSEVWVDEFQG